MSDVTTFAKRIKGYRLRIGIPQTEVERRTGIPSSTLSTWERGAGVPPTDDLWRLCDCYGVPPTELMGWTPKEKYSGSPF